MKSFVPLSKQSKRTRKAENAKQRGSWNGVRPVTRVEKDKRAYSRADLRRSEREAGAVARGE